MTERWRDAAARRSLVILATLGILGGVGPGCQQAQPFEWKYGECTGPAGDGIQGTSLLADVFSEDGFDVTTSRTLGRSIERAQVVVWFPDRFDPPGDTAIDFFNQWLAAKPNRTLVHVGRDFDAQSAYWQRRMAEATEADQLALRMLRAVSQSQWDARSARRPEEATSTWFTVRRTTYPIPAKILTGPWAESVRETAHELIVTDRFDVPDLDSDVDVMLRADEVPLILAYRKNYWSASRILFVTNASALINFSMVRPGHQQLARQLVDTCGPGGRCVFLVSGRADPPLGTQTQAHYLLRIFEIDPFKVILLHISVVGLAYCFAVVPIFGRPRRLRSSYETDFGQHVIALGGLLGQAGELLHAEQLRNEYWQKVAGALPPDQAGDNPFRDREEGDATNPAAPRHVSPP